MMKKADIAAASDTMVGMQVAALCHRRNRRGRVEILLITSRDTGRWVLAKGWPIKGLTAAGAAAREAFEEAGATGEIDSDCLGVFPYAKLLEPENELPVMVAVYALEVAELADRYPEKGQRRRKWLRPKKAAQMVAEPELAALIGAFGLARKARGKTAAKLPGKGAKP